MESNNDPFLGGPLDLPPETSPHKQTPYSAHTEASRKKKILTIIIVLMVVGAASAIAFMMLANKSSENPAPSTPQSAEVPEVKSTDVPTVSATKDYNNGPLGVTLTYPDSWKVTPTNDSGIRVESQEFTIKTLDQEDQKGYFKIYIRKGARPAKDSPVIGRGVAIAASEKLTYKAPAVGQRSDTLITNFGLDEANNFNYFFVAGNFNLKKNDTLGPDYGQEPETYIIAGGYSSTSLAEDLAFYSVAPATIKSSEAYTQAMDIVRSLKLY